MQTGFLGKVAAQADFLRLNVAGQAASLHRWLEESNESLARSSLSLAPSPAALAMIGPDGLIAGCVAPGRDRVGRTFPSVVFEQGAASAFLGADLPLLPLALAPLLESAAALLRRSDSADSAEVGRTLSTLPLLSDTDLARAREERRRQLEAPQASRFQATFEGLGASGGHLYALRTFLSACDAERRNEPGRAGLTLDCPCSVEHAVGVSLWLELLARRYSQWKTLTLLWLPERLLLSFSPPSAALLSYLAKPDHPGMKRWPLVTRQPTAVDAARTALSTASRAALESGESSLEQLLSALANA